MKRKEKPKLILAPMAGITDLPFRLICKEHGADILYSEMVSANGLYYSQSKNLAFIKSSSQDYPLIVQLFGNNPLNFAHATKILTTLTKIKRGTNDNPTIRRPEGIDINFGCPVKKVMKQNAGCALMKNLKLSRQIIQAVLKNTSLPVSIKIRAGIKKIDGLKFLAQIADLDWQTVIVHGRTFEEGFTGSIDYDFIRKIKQRYPQKTVIANGGIFSPEEALKTLKKTGADGLAIARGCLGKPWIFKNIKTYLEEGVYTPPSLAEIKTIALKHATLMKKYKGEKSLLEFRKHLAWYFKGIPEAKKTRTKLFEVKDYSIVKKIIQQIKN